MIFNYAHCSAREAAEGICNVLLESLCEPKHRACSSHAETLTELEVGGLALVPHMCLDS